MRISDWSSDVCSSDLTARSPSFASIHTGRANHSIPARSISRSTCRGLGAKLIGSPSVLRKTISPDRAWSKNRIASDRKSVVAGKSVSVRVDIGGRRIIKKKKKDKDEELTN